MLWKAGQVHQMRVGTPAAPACRLPRLGCARPVSAACSDERAYPQHPQLDAADRLAGDVVQPEGGVGGGSHLHAQDCREAGEGAQWAEMQCAKRCKHEQLKQSVPLAPGLPSLAARAVSPPATVHQTPPLCKSYNAPTSEPRAPPSLTRVLLLPLDELALHLGDGVVRHFLWTA